MKSVLRSLKTQYLQETTKPRKQQSLRSLPRNHVKDPRKAKTKAKANPPVEGHRPLSRQQNKVSGKLDLKTLTSLQPPSLMAPKRLPGRRNSDIGQEQLPRRRSLVRKHHRVSSRALPQLEQRLAASECAEKGTPLKNYLTQVRFSISSSPVTEELSAEEIVLKNDSLYKEHLYQTFQSSKLIKQLPAVSYEEIAHKVKHLPKRKGFADKKTVVFDLDETLVHCCEEVSSEADVVLPIRLPTQELINIALNIRPYARECLRKVSGMYEVIVFTASHQCYADAVLNYLDPTGTLIHHRLYRDDCVVLNGVYVKDLRVLGNRDLQEVVIIDNALYSFACQLSNGVPIISWTDNRHDKELCSLVDYLKVLNNAKDLREVNRKTFRLETFYEDYLEHFVDGDIGVEEFS